jgi:transposase InsO family protein
MVRKSKAEYLVAIRPRYQRAGLEGKRKILDEFCEVCGYHRKHAIRVLNAAGQAPRHRPGRPSIYGEAERVVLEPIWLVANRPCAVRLQPMLALWIGPYEQEHGPVAADLRQRLLGLSARTLDRLMKPVRKRHGIRGKCGTRPGTLLKKQIPIQTHHADVNAPGVLEADTVAHCGNSLAGEFLWSLTMTDIFSGWTENRAVWNRGYEGVADAIRDIEEALPFRLTGFHSDNGGEFLNHHLLRYFRDRKLPVQPTRSRPNHKDDNPYVEQKNYTHVRLLLGYERIDDPDLVALINRLYALWGLFNNLFCASRKLIEKKKVGSRYLKRYDRAATPCQRLLDSPHIDQAKKTYLTELRCNHSPFALKRQIDHLQDQILHHHR